MKKQLTALLLVLVMLFSAFAFSACKKDKQDDPDGNNGDGDANGSSAQYGSFKEAALASLPPTYDETDSTYAFFLDVSLDCIDATLADATKNFSLKKKSAVKKLYSAVAQDLIDMREVSYDLPGAIVRSITDSRTAKFIAGSGALTAEEIATVLCGICGITDNTAKTEMNDAIAKLWTDAASRVCGQYTNPIYEALYHLTIATAKLKGYCYIGSGRLTVDAVEEQDLARYFEENVRPYLHDSTTAYPGDRASALEMIQAECSAYQTESVDAHKDSALTEKASAAGDIRKDFVSLYNKVQGIKDAQYGKADLATYLNAQVAAYKALIPDTQLAEFRTTDNVPAYLKQAASVMAADLRQFDLMLTPEIIYAEVKALSTLWADAAKLDGNNQLNDMLSTLYGGTVSVDAYLTVFNRLGIDSMTALVEVLRVVLSTSDLAKKLTEVSVSGADAAVWADTAGRSLQKFVDTLSDETLDQICDAFLKLGQEEDADPADVETDRKYLAKFKNGMKQIRDRTLLQKLIGIPSAATYQSFLALLTPSADEAANDRLNRAFLVQFGIVVGQMQKLLTKEDWDAIQTVIATLLVDNDLYYDYIGIFASDVMRKSYNDAFGIYEKRYYGSTDSASGYSKSSNGYAVLAVSRLNAFTRYGNYRTNGELYRELVALDLTIAYMDQLNAYENRNSHISDETAKQVSTLLQSYREGFREAVNHDLPLFRTAVVNNAGFEKLGAAAADSTAFDAALAETNRAFSGWREVDIMSLFTEMMADVADGLNDYKEYSARTQPYDNVEGISLTPGGAAVTVTVEKGARRVFTYTPTEVCTLLVDNLGGGVYWVEPAGGAWQYSDSKLYPGIPYYLVFSNIGASPSVDDGSSSSSNDGSVTFRVGLIRDEENVTLPEGITWIPSQTFQNHKNIKSITIPASVTGIDDYAFRGCTSLTGVTFAAGSQLKTIGYGAFSGCTSLTGITIPASVNQISSRAFVDCTSLATVTFENTTGWNYNVSSPTQNAVLLRGGSSSMYRYD